MGQDEASVSSVTQPDFVQVESRFMRRLFLGFVTLAVLSLLINLAGQEIGSDIAMGGHSDDLTLREIVINNNVVTVTANMIRYPEQRRNGMAKRIDLYAQWPEMTGYTPQAKTIFNNQNQQGRLMFLSLERRSMVRDMSGRFEPIYKQMLVDAGETLPNGLTRYQLPKKSGFLDEYLYVSDPANSNPFVVRCLDTKVSTGNLAPCERDIHVGDDLVLMVRFSPLLLKHWRQLDSIVAEFAKSAIR